GQACAGAHVSNHSVEWSVSRCGGRSGRMAANRGRRSPHSTVAVGDGTENLTVQVNTVLVGRDVTNTTLPIEEVVTPTPPERRLDFFFKFLDHSLRLTTTTFVLA